MRYNLIDECEAVNGKGFGVSLYTQGCPYHCLGCFNPETWDFNKGTNWTKETENRIIELLKPKYITRLTILGGEPLIERNIESLIALLRRVKDIYSDKQVWLYTGGNFEVLEGLYKKIFQYIDVLVDGRYIDELKDLTLPFRGSSNQRIIDVQKSLQKGSIVLYLK